MKISHISLLLRKNVDKTLYTFENIYQQIFLAKFYENSKLPEGVDSIFESADSLSLKLIKLTLVRSDFCKEYLLLDIFKCIENFFSIYCQSKQMVDFHILQGKLEASTLVKFQTFVKQCLYVYHSLHHYLTTQRPQPVKNLSSFARNPLHYDITIDNCQPWSAEF